MKTFPVLPTTTDVYRKWIEISAGRLEMTAWDKKLWAAIEAGLDAGVFYNGKMMEHVLSIIPVTPEDMEIGKSHVEYGTFGYEVYTCQKEIERRRNLATQIAAGEKLSTGQVFKNITVGVHKFSTLTIESVGADGIVQFTAKKRGSPRGWNGECSATYFETKKDASWTLI